MRYGSSSQAVGSGPLLPVADMVEVAEVIQGAFQHVMGNYVGDTKTHIAAFVAGFVLQEKPYLLVTVEGLERAISVVFGKQEVTDFVFTLLFTFGTRWGMSDERFQALCRNLATSAVPNTRVALDAVPTALAGRLAASSDAAYSLLVANPWLVMLMLLQLFISLPHRT